MIPDLSALKREARKKGVPAARLLELAAQDEQLSRAVARSKHAPPGVLDALSRSPDMPTRRAVAANPLSTPALLDMLARDSQWTVLKAVATHPHAPDHLLRQLARHSRESVRFAVLDRYPLNLPDDILRIFAQSGQAADRRRVAREQGLSAALIGLLSADTDAGVLLELALYNGAQLSQDVVLRCIQDGDALLRAEATAHLIDPALLESLLQDPELWVRRNAASNRNMPPAALAQLAQKLLDDLPSFEKNMPLVHAVLFNKRTPAPLRRELRMQMNRPLRQLVDAETQARQAAP